MSVSFHRRIDGRIIVDIRHPEKPLRIKGVEIVGDALDHPDARALEPAIRALNNAVREWPVEPVTCAQVREALA